MNYSEYYSKDFIDKEFTNKLKCINLNEDLKLNLNYKDANIKNTFLLRIETVYNNKNNYSIEQKSESLILIKKAFFEIVLEINSSNFDVNKFVQAFEIIKKILNTIYTNECLDCLFNDDSNIDRYDYEYISSNILKSSKDSESIYNNNVLEEFYNNYNKHIETLNSDKNKILLKPNKLFNFNNSLLNIINNNYIKSFNSKDNIFDKNEKDIIISNKDSYQKILNFIKEDINNVLILDLYSDFIFVFIFLFSSNIKHLRKLSQNIKKDKSVDNYLDISCKADYYNYFCENSDLKELIYQSVSIRKALIIYVSKSLTVDNFIEYNIKKLIDIFSFVINVEFIYLYNIDFFLIFIKSEIINFCDFWFIYIEKFKVYVDNLFKINDLQNEYNRNFYNKNNFTNIKSASNVRNISNFINYETYKHVNKHKSFNKLISNNRDIVSKKKCKFHIVSKLNNVNNVNNNVNITYRSDRDIHNNNKNDIYSYLLNNDNRLLSDINISYETKSLYLSFLFELNSFLYNIKQDQFADLIANKVIHFYNSNFNFYKDEDNNEFLIKPINAIDNDNTKFTPIINTSTKLFVLEKYYEGIYNIANQYFKKANFEESKKYLRLFFKTLKKINISNSNKVCSSIILYAKILYEMENYEESINKLLIITSKSEHNQYGIKIDDKAVSQEYFIISLFWKAKNLIKLNRFIDAYNAIGEYINLLNFSNKEESNINKNISSNKHLFNGYKLKANILIKIITNIQYSYLDTNDIDKNCSKLIIKENNNNNNNNNNADSSNSIKLHDQNSAKNEKYIDNKNSIMQRLINLILESKCLEYINELNTVFLVLTSEFESLYMPVNISITSNEFDIKVNLLENIKDNNLEFYKDNANITLQYGKLIEFIINIQYLFNKIKFDNESTTQNASPISNINENPQIVTDNIYLNNTSTFLSALNTLEKSIDTKSLIKLIIPYLIASSLLFEKLNLLIESEDSLILCKNIIVPFSLDFNILNNLDLYNFTYNKSKYNIKSCKDELINNNTDNIYNLENCILICNNNNNRKINQNLSDNLIEFKNNTKIRINNLLKTDVDLLVLYISTIDNLGSFYISTSQTLKGVKEFEFLNIIYKLLLENKEYSSLKKQSNSINYNKLLNNEFQNNRKFSEAYYSLNPNNFDKNHKIFNDLISNPLWNSKKLDLYNIIYDIELSIKLDIIEKLSTILINFNKSEEANSLLNKEFNLLKEDYMIIIKNIKLEVENIENCIITNDKVDIYNIGKIKEDLISIINTIMDISFYYKEKYLENTSNSLNDFESYINIGINFCSEFDSILIFNKLELMYSIAISYKSIDNYTKCIYYLKNAENLIYSNSKTINILITSNSYLNKFNNIKKKILLNLGLCNLSLENYSASEQYLKSCINLYSNNIKKQGDISSAIGLCRENIGDISGAMGYYQTTLYMREKKYGENSNEYQVVVNKINMLNMLKD